MSDQTEAPIGVSEAADEAAQPSHERQGGRARRRGRRRGQARRRSGARRKQKEPATSKPQAVGDLALALEEARQDGAEASAETSGEGPSGDRAQSEAMLAELRVFEGELVEADGELERIKRKMDAARKAPEKGRRGLRRLARPDGLGRDRMPDGAILVAARMAREGRPQEEVRTFLRESFSGIDSSGVVKLAFSDEAVAD